VGGLAGVPGRLEAASFTASPQEGCAPLEVTFTNTSTEENIVGYSWDFGDGGTSGDPSPTHTYNDPDTYTVTLTIELADGSQVTETKTDLITVDEPVVADFTADETTICEGESVQFTDTSSGGGITNWSWNFGDGGTSTDRNPSHPYSAPGTYTVRLTVTGGKCSDTEVKTDYITVHADLVAAFSADETMICEGESVQFTDLSSGPVEEYEWDFGDETSAQANPSHTYAAAGTYTVRLTVTGGECSDTEVKTDYITVHADLVAAFSADETMICEGESVRFTDTSSGDGITSRLWEFGDGATSTEENPVHAYETPRATPYTVTLTIGNGCDQDVETKTGFITVGEGPTAAFAADDTRGCPPFAVRFMDQSTGSGIDDWDWDFGDGTTGSGANPSHTYTQAGLYTVELTATGDCGADVETKTGFIRVDAPVEARFTADETTICAGESVQFTDQSVGEGLTAWRWEFGDGGTSTQRSPSHTYAAAGTHDVRLTVTGACGEDVELKADHITVEPPVAADFTASPTSGLLPLAVSFTDRSSGEITFREWNFGDGTATSSAVSPSHTYTREGTFTAVLTVRGPCGETTKEETISVGTSVVADFSASPREGCVSLPVQFSDLSTGSDIDLWDWDFGDGGRSTSRNPSHTFGPGIWTVRLTASSTLDSDTETKTGYITVHADLVAAFTANQTTVCEGDEVRFTDTSSGGGITSWSWSFGDGSPPSTERNPAHAYETPRATPYTVTLTIGNGCDQDAETKTGFITVGEAPAADFTAGETRGCAPFAVQFMDRSTGSGIDGWEWDFGDGMSGSGPNPSHTYTQAGLYTVELTATGDCGADVETKTGFIRVDAPVEARFAASERSGCAPLAVTFTDQSVGEGLTAWAWEFGDGGTSTLRSPSHTYSAPGTYGVRLTVTGACGEDFEFKAGHITVDAAPPPPAEVRYSISEGAEVLVDDLVFVSWPTSVRAEGDVLERRVDGGDWDEVCTRLTEEDPGSDELSCGVTFDRAGSWRFRVTAGNDCGLAPPVEGADITVLPPDSFAYWPLGLSCPNAPDILEGNNGVPVDQVRCGTNRFGDESSALEFRGGVVEGGTLPRNDGDFSVSLWLEPFAREADDPPGPAGFFEILPDDLEGTPGIEPLALAWDDESGRLLVAHGASGAAAAVDGEGAGAAPAAGQVTVGDVARGWHHLAVTREAGVLRVYLDGIASGSTEDALGLGDAFTMGASHDGSTFFRGQLDDIRYEPRVRDREQIIALMLPPGRPTVYLAPAGAPVSVSAAPGGSVEALAMELRTGSPAAGGFAITGLLLTLEDVSAAEPPADLTPELAFSFIARVTLFRRSLCGSEDAEDFEVAEFRLDPETTRRAFLELELPDGVPIPIRPSARICFAVGLTLRPEALERDHLSLRVSVKTPGALVVDDTDGNAAFVAGALREVGNAVEGNTILVMNRPPEVFITAPTSPQTTQGTSPLVGAELHRMGMTAGPSEGVDVSRIIYRLAGKKTTLDGLSEPTLLLEDAGGAMEVARGSVNEAGTAIVFEAPPGDPAGSPFLSLPAGAAAALVLQATLSVPGAGSAGATAVRWPSRPAPPSLALLGGSLLAAVLVAASVSRRAGGRVCARLALAAALLLCATGGPLATGCGPAVIGVGIGVGLSGGGGGGGGGAPAASFQVSLDAADFTARGETTDAPVVLLLDSGEPDVHIVGPLIQVRE
jgi:PKD repeat protein